MLNILVILHSGLDIKRNVVVVVVVVFTAVYTVFYLCYQVVNIGRDNVEADTSSYHSK